MDHNYDEEDAVDPDAIESAYAAAQLSSNSNNNGGHTYAEPAYMNTSPPRIASVRTADRESAKRNLPATFRSQRYSTPLSYETPSQTRFRSPIRMPSSGSLELKLKKEPDELDDFSMALILLQNPAFLACFFSANMLHKRLRRLPSSTWGHAMSRLMDTLSSVEEAAKKCAVVTTSCQTDDWLSVAVEFDVILCHKLKGLLTVHNYIKTCSYLEDASSQSEKETIYDLLKHLPERNWVAHFSKQHTPSNVTKEFSDTAVATVAAENRRS